MIDETLEEYNNYYNSIKNIRVLKPEEELALFIRYEKKDKRARDLLVTHNLRLVASIISKVNCDSISKMDLVQQGNLILFKAIDSFDYKLGNRFSTYATEYILDSLKTYVRNNSKVIRITEAAYDKYNKIRAAEGKIEQKLNRKPSISEIAHELNISEKTIIDVKNRFNEVISLNAKASYSNESNGDETDLELIDCVSSDEISIDDLITREYVLCFGDKYYEKCDDLFDELGFSDQEKKVLTLRFGLEDGIYKTLEQVGSKLKITRERVRQIEAKCLYKIRMHLGIKFCDKQKVFSNVFIRKLQEFYECDDFSKFDVSCDHLIFKDGSSINNWWSKNKSIILNSDNDLCKKIVLQLKSYNKKNKSKIISKNNKKKSGNN